MNVITAHQAAMKWGISKRRVIVLCNEGRVPGAEKTGGLWLIPGDIPKPDSHKRGPKSSCDAIFNK